MATSATGSSAGAGDCDGDEQEDPSSSNSQIVLEIAPDECLQDEQVKESDDALLAFRQQWQRELVISPHKESAKSSKQPEQESENVEDKAKCLFLRGAELERSGKLYEAVQHYKRAVQLMPDVETRLYQSNETRADTPEETLEKEPIVLEEEVVYSDDDDDEDSGDGELVSRFQRILAKQGQLCRPAYPQKDGHISWLPYELVLVIMRWVVSSELDVASLARAGAACRGLHVASRDPDIWRTLCVKTWGLNCGTPKSQGFGSWRDMFVERPRLRLNGCYISKTTYLRHGENSFQDQFYRPWYLIDYYRYLRFFPEGVVLMWTTAEEPAACVAHLKHRTSRHSQAILSGHYRLVGDKVIIVVKKQPSSDKKQAQTSNTRFRARRKESAHDQGQGLTFQLELQLRSVRARRNWQLSWAGYGAGRRDHWTSFELPPARYPPFAFSRVRHYTAEADAPL